MPPQTPGAWLEAIYTQHWTQMFQHITRGKYAWLTDPESLADDARQHLALQLHKHGEKPEYAQATLTKGYVTVLFKQHLTDVIRAKQGRPRPRKWLRAHGKLGEQLFILFCLQQLKRLEIWAKIQEEFKGETGVLQAHVRHILDEMESQQECDRWTSDEVSVHPDDDDGQIALNLPSEAPPPEEDTLERIICMLFSGGLDIPGMKGFALKIKACRDRLGEPAILTDEQLYSLQAFYIEGDTDQEIAAFLDASERTVRYQRKVALEKIKRIVAEYGISDPRK